MSEIDSLVNAIEGLSIRPTLMPHQIKALDFIDRIEKRAPGERSGIRGGFLSMEMGMGKTLTMLQQIQRTKVPGQAPTLVLCPKTAMYTWKNEIQKFFPGDLHACVFRKEEIKVDLMSRAALSNYDIVITNYDYIRSLATKMELKKKVQITKPRGEGEAVVGANAAPGCLLNDDRGEGILFSIRWHRIVADESHAFSNMSTALAQSMLCLAADLKWCVTGTPIRNWATDLYSQFKFLGLKDSSFSKGGFDQLGFKNFMHSATYDSEKIKLPDVSHQKIPVTLDTRNTEIYKMYLEQACEAYDDFVCGTTTFDCVLVAFLRLRQACVAPFIVTPDLTKKDKDFIEKYQESQRGLQLTTKGLSIWINQEDGTAGKLAPKVQKTIEIIKGTPPGEKVIVFSMFKRALKLAAAGCEFSHVHLNGDITGEARAHALDNFKTGDAKVMFANYKVGAESLNLTEANHIILMEPWWCPAVIEQAKARIQRLGQTKSTYIYELCIANLEQKTNIEENILKLCESKKESAKNFFTTGAITGREGLDARAIGRILER